MRKALSVAALSLLLTPGPLVQASAAFHEASVDSDVITTLPWGQRVRIVLCSGGWCQARHTVHSGYLSTIAPMIDPHTTRSGRGYINLWGERIPSPTWTKKSVSHPARRPCAATARIAFVQVVGAPARITVE